MFCPYCGQANQSHDLTCVTCGRVLPGAGPAPQAAPPAQGGGWGQAPTPAPYPPSAPAPYPPQTYPPAAPPPATPAHQPARGGATAANPVVQPPPGRAHSEPLVQRPRTSNETQFLDPRSALRELESQRSIPGGGRLLGRVKLVVEQGQILGEQFLLADRDIVIGRYDAGSGRCPDIDLGAQDPSYVHRMHARIRFSDAGDRIVVQDLGGRNGAYINNRPVDRNGTAPLSVGDKLRIGRVVMRLVPAPEVDDLARG